MDFPECTDENSSLKISITDKGSKNKKSTVHLQNQHRLTLKIVKIDDCVIRGSSIRCDSMVVVPNPKEEIILIELKGHKVERAIQQLEATLSHIKQKCSAAKTQNITCIVCCTRCPLSGTDIQREKKKFKDKHRARLLIKSGPLTHPI